MKDEAAKELYKVMKEGKPKFNEEIHCPLILKIMNNSEKGTFSAFCVEAKISERTFYNWLKDSELFLECYSLGKMFAREQWEREGREIREEVTMPGTSNYKFEHWRMIGWSKFGIGKNSRIRLNLDPGTPLEHYNQLLLQASQGDFTAGEIKQLMEAINVGLNTHQVFKLQDQINQIKSDQLTMKENSRVHNSFTNQATA